MLEGELVLIEDEGETVLKPAMPRASRPTAATAIISSTNPIATRSISKIGTRSKHERVDYPEVDLMVVRDDKGMRYTHKNGDPL